MACTKFDLTEGNWNYDKDKGVLVWGIGLGNKESLS